MNITPTLSYRILVMSVLSSTAAFSTTSPASADNTFGDDVRLLAEHVKTIVLGKDENNPSVAIVPAYQARVMTSSAKGVDGTSYGWINHKQVAAGITPGAQINVFGGEERFWLGPEGGQFSIFFPPGADFEFASWQTPAVIDTVPYKVHEANRNRAAFRHETRVKNYSGTEFGLRIDRTIELLTSAEIANSLGAKVADVAAVGYRTTNRVTNIGDADWTKESGLLSIWILGMYKHGPKTTVVIPLIDRDQTSTVRPVNDTYFGKVPADRLSIRDNVVFFSGDGQHRSKIGIPPQHATPICGSFDAARNVLTIVKYNQPGPDVTDYVNSMWELQDKPFAGDAVNAYNDGPPEPGADPLGPFYELETSSPALALKVGDTGSHIQETYHFEGDRDQLDEIARAVLGVSLEQIEVALR